MAMKIGVLLSGSGTNLQAIIDAIADGRLDAEIAHRGGEPPRAPTALSGRPPPASRRFSMTSRGLPCRRRRTLADEVIASMLQAVRRRVRGDGRVHAHGARPASWWRFPNRVVNLHPALLPAFKGAHAIEEAWTRGVKVTGVTVHFANADYDCGPIIAQRAVEVDEGMSLGRARGAYPRYGARALSRDPAAYRRRSRARDGRQHREDRPRFPLGCPCFQGAACWQIAVGGRRLLCT